VTRLLSHPYQDVLKMLCNELKKLIRSSSMKTTYSMDGRETQTVSHLCVMHSHTEYSTKNKKSTSMR